MIVEGDGTAVLDYHSRSETCGAPARGPSVSAATQTLSIPWQLVSLHGQTVTFRYQNPACDPFRVSSWPLGSDSKTEQGSVGVLIKAPYTLTYDDLLHCGGSWTTTSADFGLPPGTPGAPPAATPSVVLHDPTGPLGGSGRA